MGARAKAVFPLALVIGVLSFLWTEFALNFTFHWGAAGNLGNGLDLPKSFHLILPTAFISWGLFFAAGGDNAAFGKVFLACVIGSVAALITMGLSFKTADLPDFWGIALWVGVFAFLLVMILIFGDWYYVAGTFPAFAATFLWWIATGLDGWAINGGGIKSDVPTIVGSLTQGILAKDSAGATAGFGAFAGILSTPWQWVWFDTFVTLVCGCILGIVSGKITAAITPKPKVPAEA